MIDLSVYSEPEITPRTHHRLKIFFDGGCRPNPGRIETAVVVRGVSHLFDDLGHGTNSDAEWLALICALELAQSLSLTNIELIGDAREVIQQAQSAMSTGRAKHGHAARFLALMAGNPRARIRWIKRAQNLAGIALAARHPR
jgi:ribonuclease HI